MARAYLFDFNGVLVDDEAVHFAALRDVIADYGFDLDEPTYLARFLPFDDRTALGTMLVEAGHGRDEALVTRLIAEKSKLYFEQIDGALKIFPGAFELLIACASRGAVAIVSGAAREEIDHALLIAGAGKHVTTIVAAEDVAACKPDPAGYVEALARLGVAPSEVVVIEDSAGGVEAACAAGCAVVAVAHSEAVETLLGVGARRVVATIGELTVDALDAVLVGA